jgi:hypothetical protein
MERKVDGPSRHRFQGIASLAREKTLSEAADVAGIDNTYLATLDNFGNISALYLHQCNGITSQLAHTLPKYRLNSSRVELVPPSLPTDLL